MLVGTCPYYMYDKGNILFCEGATLKYPDKKAKNDHLGCYCCSVENGYKKCTMNGILEEYYERLYNGDVIEPLMPEKVMRSGKRGRRPKMEGGR